jgi:predicted RNase H-like nuclease
MPKHFLPVGRNICRACRFQKCLNVGMEPDAIRPDRDKTGKQKNPRRSHLSSQNSAMYTAGGGSSHFDGTMSFGGTTKSTASSVAGELNQARKIIFKLFYNYQYLFLQLITEEDIGNINDDPLARRRANTINDLRSLAEEIRRSQREHDQQQLQRISESTSALNNCVTITTTNGGATQQSCDSGVGSGSGGGNNGASSPEFEQMSQEKALIIQVRKWKNGIGTNRKILFYPRQYAKIKKLSLHQNITVEFWYIFQTLREIERIVCLSDAAAQNLLNAQRGGGGGTMAHHEEEMAAAKLRREFDAAIRAGSLGEREQMMAAIQQPKLIAERTEVGKGN